MAMNELPTPRRATVFCGAIAVAVMLAGTLAAGAQSAPPPPPYLKNFPNFAPQLTPQVPGDVDIDLKKQLEAAQQFPKVQREFDLNAWQMFLSLNWPTNDQGQPAQKITDTNFGPPHWTLWQNSSSIYQESGAPPQACAKGLTAAPLAAPRDLSKPVSKGLPAFSLPTSAVAPNLRATRFLGVLSAVGELNAANLGGDIQQAFTGPLIDQYGNFVFYEIMIDPNEVKYLCDNTLYNINGQVDFFKAQKTVDMPTGHPHVDGSGSFELKLAWRVMQKQCDPNKPNDGPCDDLGRYFVEDAYIMDQGPDGKPLQRRVKVGLVGMHIAHKSETSPQWIWATFEQVDNLSVDQVAHPQLQASFNNANCPICVTDLQPVQGANGVYPRIPVQVSRTIPIPADKVALNDEASTTLAAQSSVWQYYELIDTQWPTAPTVPPASPLAGLPDAVANKPGGNPTPVFLTNITMETYFQSGNQPACNNVEGSGNIPNCPPPYATVTPGTAIAAYAPVPANSPVNWTTTLNNRTPPPIAGTMTQILATESCMGCHSSAGIWASYNPQTGNGAQTGQLTGDFSWLMSQKAQWAPVH
jgi:hypothetical protein